jgi:hypothetical protein
MNTTGGARTKVHLAVERQLAHLHLTLVEGVVDRLIVDALRLVHLPDLAEDRVVVERGAKRCLVARLAEDLCRLGVERADGRVQRLAVRDAHRRLQHKIFWHVSPRNNLRCQDAASGAKTHTHLVQRRPERVERDVDGHRVRASLQDLPHDDGGVTANFLRIHTN